MSLLSLNISSCVRVSNKLSTCEECVKACPVQTIQIYDNTPSFIPNDCVGCGGCLGACPSSAYSLDDFSPINYIFDFLESKKEIVSCKDKLPCIAALSVEEMLSFSILNSGDLLFDKSFCSECSIAQTNLSIIEERIEEVNFLLEAMQVDKKIIFESFDEKKSNNDILNRREILSKISINDAIKMKQKFANEVNSQDEEIKLHKVETKDIKNILHKDVPQKRKLLAMALKKIDKPKQLHILDINDISFSSQKKIDPDTCTNCQMCYRICPTGALSSNNYGEFINFDAFNCIKCRSCHDVCEPNALTLKDTFSLAQIIEPKKDMLLEFNIKRCNECGMPFAYKSGEIICTRCKIEEDEALSLWGIN